GLDHQSPKNPLATKPMALETTALNGAEPNATSMGKVTNVPEPTTVLIVPAHSPPRKTRASRQNSITWSFPLIDIAVSYERMPSSVRLHGAGSVPCHR